MRVFSKEKFIEDNGYDVYLKCKGWVDECDGKRVVGKYVGDYLTDPNWEIDTSESTE